MANYWIGEVEVDQGRCWTTVLVDTPDGKVVTTALCLGKEQDIVPILKRKSPIPDNLNPKIMAVLMDILAKSDAGEQKKRGKKPKSEALEQKVMPITQTTQTPSETQSSPQICQVSVSVKSSSKTYTSNIIRFATEVEARFEAKKLRRLNRDKWYDAQRAPKEYQEKGLFWQVREVSRR